MTADAERGFDFRGRKVNLAKTKAPPISEEERKKILEPGHYDSPQVQKKEKQEKLTDAGLFQ